MHHNVISEDALLRRINRRLYRDEFRIVKRCRESSRAYLELGRFYVIDYGMNVVVDKYVDLWELGAELGVLPARSHAANEG